jgi:hypothetical protein
LNRRRGLRRTSHYNPERGESKKSNHRHCGYESWTCKEAPRGISPQEPYRSPPAPFPQGPQIRGVWRKRYRSRCRIAPPRRPAIPIVDPALCEILLAQESVTNFVV